jgi:Protein of unknown function (DUF3631)
MRKVSSSRCPQFPRNVEDLSRTEPVTVAELGDRHVDIWEPLFAVADGVGGDWPKRIRDAARVLSGQSKTLRDDELGAELLRRVRDVFATSDRVHEGDGFDYIAVSDLLPVLNSDPQAPWADWRRSPSESGLSDRKLSMMLAEFDVETHRQQRLGSQRTWLDMDKQLSEAIERYA